MNKLTPEEINVLLGILDKIPGLENAKVLLPIAEKLMAMAKEEAA